MECDRPDGSKSGVRQGDILAAHPGTENWKDKWRRFYVVVTADCDMAQQKNKSGVVVVPIIGLTTYLDEVWLVEQISKYKNLLNDRLEPLLNRFSGSKLIVEEVLKLDEADLKENLTNRAAADSDLLKLVDNAILAHRNSRLLEKIKNEIPAEKPADSMAQFFEVKNYFTGSEANQEKELLGALQNILDPKRLDTWPICDLLGLDGQMKEDESLGFVACFRFFTTVQYEKVFVSKDDWLKDQFSYHRICRLRGAYKTDLVQKFAQMFSRVGLEDERDKEHQRIFAHAAKRISKRMPL